VSQAPLAPSDAEARIAVLEASLARANAALAARDLLIETLRGQIARLRRMQFGASSEKLTREIAQLELALDELETESAVPDTPVQPASVRALPDHLPREEVVHEPASGACTCPDCGGALRRLGQDAHEVLDVLPVHWRVVRNVRPKYSCRTCERIVQAAAPVKAVARGKATSATLAHVVVSKFEHHLPLYRQSEIMAAQGVDIDRSTLAGWVGQAAALLDPIVSRIREDVLKGDKIHADDTPVPVLDPGADAPRPGGYGSMQSTTAPRATRPRLRHGIASRPTAPVHIRKPISPDFEVFSRPTPMQVTTASIEAAPPKSHAGLISGARCSTCTSGLPRR
jgi:transposase